MLMQVRRSLFPPAKPLAAQRSKSGHIHWGLGSSGAVTGDKLGTAMSGAVLAAFWVAREYLDNRQATLTGSSDRTAKSRTSTDQHRAYRFGLQVTPTTVISRATILRMNERIGLERPG